MQYLISVLTQSKSCFCPGTDRTLFHSLFERNNVQTTKLKFEVGTEASDFGAFMLLMTPFVNLEELDVSGCFKQENQRAEWDEESLGALRLLAKLRVLNAAGAGLSGEGLELRARAGVGLDRAVSPQ